MERLSTNNGFTQKEQDALQDLADEYRTYKPEASLGGITQADWRHYSILDLEADTATHRRAAEIEFFADLESRTWPQA